MQLSYIRLHVKDLKAMRDWYSTKIGLSIVSEARDAVVLAGKGGGSAIELVQGKPVSNPERITLAFNVEDVSVTFKRMYDGGIRFLGDPQKGAFGRIVARLKDPAGHVVEIFTLDQSGIR